MTATVTQLTVATYLASNYGPLSRSFGFLAIALLIVLLFQKEVGRAFGGRRSQRWIEISNIVVAPLLISFGVVFAMRIAALLK